MLSDGNPCFQSDRFNVRPKKYLFSLEIPMGQGCTRDFNNDMFTDPRYRMLTQFNINEYDFMNANNILQYVRNLPGYYYQLNSYD